MPKSVAEFVAEAKAQCNCIDAEAAKSMYDNTENTILLDVREPDETQANKLAGSINIPRGVLEMRIMATCPNPEQAILIHCAAGGRAAMSAARLQEMGYKNVHVIDCKFDDIKEVFG